MILGSHNTMSYVTPLVWWRRLLRPFYRCQAKTLEGQIAAGVRWFDIRVAQDGDGRFVCAHGGTLLDADPVDAIETIESLAPGSVVRVVLERCDSIKTAEDFAGLCELLEEFMPQVCLTGGVQKRGCVELHRFRGEPVPEPLQWVGSMQPPLERGWWKRPWRYWGGALPCLWAALHNHRLDRGAFAEDQVVLMDFV